MNRNFGHLITRLLKERGWTQKVLADLSNMTSTNLNKIIKGTRRPNSENIKNIARSFGEDIDFFHIAAGQIPSQLYSVLCKKSPETTLSILRGLAASLSEKGDERVEELSRDVLLRYLRIVGRQNFSYPLDVKDLVEKVYGLNVLKKSFHELKIHKTDDETLCGLLIPNSAEIGKGCFNNLILLNSDVLDKNRSAEEIGRFTIAHEAFHQEMWKINQVNKDSYHNTNEEIIYCRIREIRTKTESKANYFAGALLMPKKDLLKKIDKYPKPFDFTPNSNIFQKRYGVTKSAFRTRLMVLHESFIETTHPEAQQLPLFNL